MPGVPGRFDDPRPKRNLKGENLLGVVGPTDGSGDYRSPGPMNQGGFEECLERLTHCHTTRYDLRRHSLQRAIAAEAASATIIISGPRIRMLLQ